MIALEAIRIADLVVAAEAVRRSRIHSVALEGERPLEAAQVLREAVGTMK